MSNLLKYLDYFGITFEFTTFKESKFKTSFGGVMTLLCSFTVIFFTMIFGNDFFFKLNPRVVGQTVYPANYSLPYSLTPENLVIPFRFVDGENQPVNTTGLFSARGVYYQTINNQTGTTVTNILNIPITTCNENVSKVKEFNQFNKLSDWFCFDWTANNYTLGGYWDAPFTNYFYLELDFCSNGIFTLEGNCTDLSQVKTEFHNEIYFSMMYPTFYFVPEDVHLPLHIAYEEYHFILDLNIQKTDRLYFSDIKLSDDSGWMFSKINETTIHGAKDFKTDMNYFDTSDYGKKGVSSVFYSVIFYTKKNYDYYTRSFMKIQDLAAVAGGFMNIIFFTGGLIVDFYNTNMRDQKLFSELFQFKQETKDKCNDNHQADSTIKHFNTAPGEKILRLNKGVLGTSEKSSGIINRKFKFLSQKRIDNIQSESIKIIKSINVEPSQEEKDNKELKNIIQYNSINIDKPPDEQIDNLEKRRNYSSGNLSELDKKLNHTKENNFGLFFMIKRIFKCRFKKAKKERVYNLSQKYLNERLDVTYYLKTCEGFDRLKSILFNPQQKNSFKFIKITNLYDETELSDFEKGINENSEDVFDEVVHYFKNKRGNYNEIDKQLLNFLNPRIKELSYR